MLAVLLLCACGGPADPGQGSSADPMVAGSTVDLGVSPAEATVLPGGKVQLTTTSSTGETVTWTATGGGTVDSAGLYTAPSAPGTYLVEASSSGSTITTSSTSAYSASALTISLNNGHAYGKSKIIVTNPPVAVSVTPSSESVQEGATVTLSATVANTTNTAVTWAVQEAGGGSVTATGVYTAPSTAGTYHVVATSVADPTKSGTSTASVSSPPPPAPGVAVSVTPSSAAIGVGGTVSFTATVANATNTAVTWAVQEAGGGSVTASGAYTAPSTAGTYHVVATSVADATQSATATVTVSAPPVAVSVSPMTASVSTGAPVSFFASVANTTNQAVTWSVQEGATGGSVTSAGVYTAPSAAGTYHVLATSQADTTKSATATVTVTAPSTVAYADYYVSPSGSGTACSSASPCSLSTAMSQLNGLGSNSARSGKIVQLAAGDYSPFSLGAGQSGPDATHRVVFLADPNAASPVRILGGTKVTSWAQCTSSNCSTVWNSLPAAARSGGVGGGSHVYVASISSIGSYPADLYSTRGWWATDSYAPFGGSGNPSGPTMLLSAIPPTGYCTNGYYNGRLCPLPTSLARYPNRDPAGRDQWVTSWGGRDYTGSGAVIQAIMDAYASQASPFGTGVGISQGAYVLNAVQELDSAGEYWIDRTSGVVYFWPWVDGDPSTNGGEVMVGTTSGAILNFASGSQYVEVKGVTVEGGQTHCVGIAGTGNQLTNAVVRNCAGNDVRLGGTNNTINGGKFSNAGNDGIVYTSVSGESVSGGTVTNAEISEWGMYRATYTRAMLIGGDGLSLSHNKMYSGTGPCVTFEGKNSTIEYNDMSRCPLNGNDNGSVYAWASGSVNVGTTIRYNYFHDIPSSSNVAGAFSSPDVVIYQDDNINGVSNYGNMLYNVGHNTGSQYDNSGFPRMGMMSKGANTFTNNVLVNVDGWNWNSTMYFIGSATGSNNLFVDSAYGYNSSRGTDVTALPITSSGSGTAPFVNTGAASRDLSNNTCGGSRCFTSGAFTTDPNGLNYIPWSLIGIQ